MHRLRGDGADVLDLGKLVEWKQGIVGKLTGGVGGLLKNHGVRTIMGTDPHVGDLLNVAKNDEDRTFRIAATLQLGIAKFTDGNPGNRSAINAYLGEAKQSDDPMLAEAAAAADALTLEDFRTLR